MRYLLGMLLVILGIGSGCGRGSYRDKSETLGSSRRGTVLVETWYEDALLSQPVWKICLQPNGSTNREVLFTVNSVFQESDPGYPHLVVTNGDEMLQDFALSYAYSLSSRQFITNAWTHDVYTGDYRPRP